MLPVQHSSCQFPLCCVAMFGKTGCRQRAFSSLEPLSLSLFIILHLAALIPFFSLFFIVNCPNFCFSCPQSARNPYVKVAEDLKHLRFFLKKLISRQREASESASFNLIPITHNIKGLDVQICRRGSPGGEI